MLRGLIALALAALAMAAAPAPGGVRLAPVSLAMAPERPIASLKLTNERLSEAAFEALVFSWTQDRSGEHILQPSNDFVVAPSTFLVAPGQSQTVRLGAAAAFRGGAERSYRLLLRELPVGPASEAIDLRIEMGVPLFVRPRGAAPRLEVAPSPDGTIHLRNSGEAHLRLYPSTDVPSPPRYLLPGADVVRPAPANAALVRLRFAAPEALSVEERSFSLTAHAGHAAPGR